MRSSRQPRWGSAIVARVRRGFTLVEMVVTVAIVAILLGIAIPSYNETILNMKLTSYANNLVASILLGRSEAIKRNAVVTLCVSSSGTACTAGGWQQGWILMCKTTDNTTCNPAGVGTIVIQTQPPLSTGWKISEVAALTAIAFQPTGTGATSADLTVCRSSPLGTMERHVMISGTGRPSTSKTTAGVCP